MFDISNTHKDLNTFHLRMQLAALKQFLRDRQTELTEEEIDQILDQIKKVTDMIDEVEEKK